MPVGNATAACYGARVFSGPRREMDRARALNRSRTVPSGYPGAQPEWAGPGEHRRPASTLGCAPTTRQTPSPPALWGLVAALVATLCVPPPAGAVELPSASGWVNDFAGVIEKTEQQRLEETLTELERKTGAEVAVVTLRSVPDGDVETAAIHIFESWGIGKKAKDNGALILCAVDNRRVRIEVGYGLEEILPDAKSGRIIDAYMLPALRRGDLSTGLVTGARVVAGIIAEDAGVTLSGAIPLSRGQPGWQPGWGFLVVFLLIMIVAAIVIMRNPELYWAYHAMGGRRGYGYGGYHHGGLRGWPGGFGGSSGGFGGFGGFGGGLSGGGGASRGW